MTDKKDKALKRHVKFEYIPDVLGGKRKPKSPETTTATVGIFVYKELISEESGKQGLRGKGKQGSKGVIRHSIELICQHIESTSYKDFINAIDPAKEDGYPGDNELINDLYEKLNDPLEIHLFEIGNESLHFKYRDDIQDKRSLGTIKNILSKIKLK